MTQAVWYVVIEIEYSNYYKQYFPKLTKKLLSKPPFRFLHDLIRVSFTKLGFGQDLYTENELAIVDSSLNWTKAEKRFLFKLIRLIELHLNIVSNCKASKIVEGLEGENTNYMLQLFAICIFFRRDSCHSVQQIVMSLFLVKL